MGRAASVLQYFIASTEGPSDKSLNLASLDSIMSFSAASFSFTEGLSLLLYIFHASFFAS
jgi:hypothetical protein